MKKIKKMFLNFLSITLGAFTLISCGDTNKDNSSKDESSNTNNISKDAPTYLGMTIINESNVVLNSLTTRYLNFNDYRNGAGPKPHENWPGHNPNHDEWPGRHEGWENEDDYLPDGFDEED